MSEAKIRVEEELGDLQGKRVKLDLFLGSEKAKTLSEPAYSLLHAQYHAMTAYAGLLAARLEIWND